MKKTSTSASQMSLPGALQGRVFPSRLEPGKCRIPHAEILRMLQDPARGFADIAEVYRSRILPSKTRHIRLLGRKAPARIVKTLLGYELKASYKRIQCPDLVTARYLKLFTELGCRNIRLPYDPTLTEEVIPDLELAIANIMRSVRDLFPRNRKLQMYVVRRICRHLRSRLTRHFRDSMTAASNRVDEAEKEEGAHPDSL